MKWGFVGAGSVGQTYAWFAHAGGAQVAFLVKPHHVQGLQGGLPQYLLNRSSARSRPERLVDYTLVTSARELADWKPDVVFLCTSSDALRLPWVEELLHALPDTCTVVTLAAGIHDADRIRGLAGASRTVVGLIALIAYHAPLPGEQVPEPGNAIWFPPFSACPFDGPDAALAPILATLRRGGMPVRQQSHLDQATGWPNAFLMPFLVGLEASDWKFRTLLSTAAARQVCLAVDETCGVVATRVSTRRPLFTRILTPFTLRTILFAARFVVPIDLQTYLQVHFTKVGPQTRMFVDEYIDAAAAAGLPVTSLTGLRNRLPAATPSR
jgi:2-dehydropantoate 2-reductase